MTMREAITHFSEQLAYEPVIENGSLKKQYTHYIVAGMGGSALSVGLLETWDSNLGSVLKVLRDYRLPQEIASDTLLIASSYSGNTEETISAFEEARKRNIDVAVIAVGGKLIDLAKEHSIPYIQIPDTKIQPRCALGFSVKALLKFVGKEDALTELTELSKTLDPLVFEESGKSLALELKDHIPVIYSSLYPNAALSYTWKIKFNETGKVPAFANVLSEMNHNEMNSFDVSPSTKHLTDHFSFIILRDSSDNPHIQKRMNVLEKLYRDRGLPVKTLELSGKTVFEKMFSSLLLADWTALYTAELYGRDPNDVPMIEEFKKLMAS